MHLTKRFQARGFTVIELMVATLIFTVIMIVLTTGILQFSREYYKGVISSQTQSVTRSIVDEVVRSIQYNSGEVSELTSNSAAAPGRTTVYGYCLGGTKRFSFSLNRQIKDSGALGTNQARHGLISDTTTGCNANTRAWNPANAPTSLAAPVPTQAAPSANARELLGEHMRVAKFEITPGANGLYTVTVKVIYGDNDLLTDLTSNAMCRTTIGSQFCAVSELTTTVQKRVE